MLEGDVPSPVNPPQGCPFHPRCRYATDICRTDIPALKQHEAGGRDHLAACHRVDELGVLTASDPS